MSHPNAKLTPAGRLLIVQQIEDGFSQAEVARRMYLSRSTVAKWWRRKLGATSWLFPRVCEMPSSVVVRCAP